MTQFYLISVWDATPNCRPVGRSSKLEFWSDQNWKASGDQNWTPARRSMSTRINRPFRHFHCTSNRNPEFPFSRLFGQCSDVWPDSSPDPSLRESQPSPHRSQQDVTSHSPRHDASHQAKPPRRRAVPPLLSCDCRLQPSPQDACQKRYFARMRGTTGFVGSGRVSRT